MDFSFFGFLQYFVPLSAFDSLKVTSDRRKINAESIRLHAFELLGEISSFYISDIVS